MTRYELRWKATNGRRLCAILVWFIAVFCCITTSSSLLAATYYWNGATSQLWMTGTNWDGGSYPNPSSKSNVLVFGQYGTGNTYTYINSGTAFNLDTLEIKGTRSFDIIYGTLPDAEYLSFYGSSSIVYNATATSYLDAKIVSRTSDNSHDSPLYFSGNGTGTLVMRPFGVATWSVPTVIKSGTFTLDWRYKQCDGVYIRATQGIISYSSDLTGAYLGGGGGTHLISTPGNTFTRVTNNPSSLIQQDAATTFANVTNRGTVNNNATLAWQGGLNDTGGSFNVNSTANTSEWVNNGVVTINSGGILNNSTSNLTSGGGSRIYVGSVSTPGGQLNLQGGTSLDLQGSLLVNNGTITGPTNVQYGATAKGGGMYGAVNVYDGGQFSPGNSPGAVTTGAVSWNAGGKYVFEIDDATGTAGTNWDLWNITDTLSIDAGTTPNSKFTIDLNSLSGLSAGPAEHFNNLQSYQWLIADATSGISGFDPAVFAVDTSGFANALGGGSFSVSQGGNNIYLNFVPVPEPSTLALLGFGAVSILGYVWRRRRR